VLAVPLKQQALVMALTLGAAVLVPGQESVWTLVQVQVEMGTHVQATVLGLEPER